MIQALVILALFGLGELERYLVLGKEKYEASKTSQSGGRRFGISFLLGLFNLFYLTAVVDLVGVANNLAHGEILTNDLLGGIILCLVIVIGYPAVLFSKGKKNRAVPTDNSEKMQDKQ